MQATFHFRTFLDDEDRTEIDDSKRLGEPFTLIFGKKFKLEVWESMIETMRVDEIASFHCKYYVSMIIEFFPIHNVISGWHTTRNFGVQGSNPQKGCTKLANPPQNNFPIHVVISCVVKIDN